MLLKRSLREGDCSQPAAENEKALDGASTPIDALDAFARRAYCFERANVLHVRYQPSASRNDFGAFLAASTIAVA